MDNATRGFVRMSNTIFFSVNEFREGSSNHVAISANTILIAASKTVSQMNCIMSCFLPAPIVFLTPTSLALCSDLDVARLTKLKHAISKIKKAIMVSAFT